MVKNPLSTQEMEEMQIRSLGWEDPREEGIAIHRSILAWRIPWTEEPVGLQSIGLHRVGHDLKQLSTHMPQIGTWGYALLEKPRKLALRYSNVSFLKPG